MGLFLVGTTEISLQEASSTPVMCLKALTIPRSLRSICCLHVGLSLFFVREVCHVKGGLEFKALSDKTLSRDVGGTNLGTAVTAPKHPREASLLEVLHAEILLHLSKQSEDMLLLTCSLANEKIINKKKKIETFSLL